MMFRDVSGGNDGLGLRLGLGLDRYEQIGLGLEPLLSKLPIPILTFFDGLGSGLVPVTTKATILCQCLENMIL
eukprot:scaffold28701_cov56-Attheya_sp.AAC.1